MITDLQMTYAAFDLWLSAEGEDNRAELERVKRILPMILEECCTVKQMEYIKLYFIERMSMREIALHCGVNASSVCRGIHYCMHICVPCACLVPMAFRRGLKVFP